MPYLTTAIEQINKPITRIRHRRGIPKDLQTGKIPGSHCTPNNKHLLMTRPNQVVLTAPTCTRYPRSSVRKSGMRNCHKATSIDCKVERVEKPGQSILRQRIQPGIAQ